MFSETRYALNGDLRVAYRASREGARDIVSVPNWFTCCEVLPELPSIQGWVDAMTSLGRLIYFDQPGTGASDPVIPDAMPTLEQWADSITAVLDAIGSREAVLVASNSAFAPAALFAATHPSRTTALVVLDGYADAGGTPLVQGGLGWSAWPRALGRLHKCCLSRRKWTCELSFRQFESRLSSSSIHVTR
jgi:pimeloyl-ACP methyl ester carboxylesterase